MLVFVATFFFAQTAFALESRTGFIGNEIWTNDVDYVDGQEVILYTGVFNGEDEKLNIVVEFFDDKELLGARDVFIESASAKIVSLSWQLTQGDHEVYSVIRDAKIDGEQVSLSNSETKSQDINVKFNLQEVIEEQQEAVEDKIDETTDILKDINIPEPVEGVFAQTEAVRDSLHDVLEEQHEIAVEASEENSEEGGIKKSWNKIKQGGTWLGAFIAKHKLLFYVFSIFIVYVIIRKLFKVFLRIIKGRRSQDFDEE